MDTQINNFSSAHKTLGWNGVMLCRVEVKSEQASLESFAEDGEWLCCPDIGWEFIPPVSRQNREESWLCWAINRHFSPRPVPWAYLSSIASNSDGWKELGVTAATLPSKWVSWGALLLWSVCFSSTLLSGGFSKYEATFGASPHPISPSFTVCLCFFFLNVC